MQESDNSIYSQNLVFNMKILFKKNAFNWCKNEPNPVFIASDINELEM